jgi:hypothetical protein
MKKILIIPDRNDLRNTFALQKEYNLGFEYNDFFMPDILDDIETQDKIIKEYNLHNLPEYTTMHGAFFDVTPISIDEKIKESRMFRAIDINMDRCFMVVISKKYFKIAK